MKNWLCAARNQTQVVYNLYTTSTMSVSDIDVKTVLIQMCIFYHVKSVKDLMDNDNNDNNDNSDNNQYYKIIRQSYSCYCCFMGLSMTYIKQYMYLHRSWLLNCYWCRGQYSWGWGWCRPWSSNLGWGYHTWSHWSNLTDGG